MRLAAVRDSHRLPARLFLGAAEFVARRPVDAVVVTMTHRPELWGRWFSPIIARTMRGPSYWTAAERECMAVAVSRANECPYCLRTHTEVGRIAHPGLLDDAASQRPALGAMLVLLDRLTRDPDAVGPEDVEAVRRAGVPDDALEDAFYVAFVFNCVNRVANALDFSYASEDDVRFTAKVLHRISYRLPAFALH